MEKEIFDELIKCVRRGDNIAFRQIVCAYQSKVISVIYKCGVEEDFEDVAQETWNRFYKSIGRYNEISLGLIFKIARNEANRYLGKQRQNPAKPSEVDIFEFENLEKDENISELLEKKQRRKQIFECVKKLPPEFREVIILRDIYEYEYTEIANLLDISLYLVKTRIHRGRKLLRKILFDKDVVTKL